MKQRKYSHGGKVRSDSKSGYRGVQTSTRDGKHSAYITDPATKKKIVLGVFRDPKIAARAHDEAAKHFYGDDAILNFSEAQYRKGMAKQKSQWKRPKKQIPQYGEEVSCKTCGTMFHKRTPNHLYCNPKCRPSEKSGGAGRWIVMHRDKFRCCYCGSSTVDGTARSMHIDHIHPVAAGGKDTLSNVVTSCRSCNQEKSDTILSNEEEVLAIVESRNKESGLDPKTIIKINSR